jgi:hypothetical protein
MTAVPSRSPLWVLAALGFAHLAWWALLLLMCLFQAAQLPALYARFQMKMPWLSEMTHAAINLLVLRPPFVAFLLPLVDLGVFLFLHLRPGTGLARCLWTLGILLLLFWHSFFVLAGWMLAIAKLNEGFSR